MNPHEHNDRDLNGSGAGDESYRDWVWEHIARNQRAADDPLLGEDAEALERALYAEIDDAELLEAAAALDELEAEIAAEEGDDSDQDGEAEAPILGGPSYFRRFFGGQASGLAYAMAALIAITVAGAIRGRVLTEHDVPALPGPSANESADLLDTELLYNRQGSVDALGRLMNAAIFTIDVARARISQGASAEEVDALEQRIDELKMVALGSRDPDPTAVLSDELHDAIWANIESGRDVTQMIGRLDDLFDHSAAVLAVCRASSQNARTALSTGLAGDQRESAERLDAAFEALVNLIVDA